MLRMTANDRPVLLLIRCLGWSVSRESTDWRNECPNEMGSTSLRSLAGRISAERWRCHGIDEIHSARRSESQSRIDTDRLISAFIFLQRNWCSKLNGWPTKTTRRNAQWKQKSWTRPVVKYARHASIYSMKSFLICVGRTRQNRQ